MSTTTQPELTDENRPVTGAALGLGMRLLADMDRFSTGVLLMQISDTHCEVSDADGNVVGAIGCAVGGTFYVQIGSRLWEIDREGLFRAALKADAAYIATP